MMATKTLNLPTPSKARWTVLRVGILNVWEYDDQEFILHSGRMLLRGPNESGKTKALELLFPMLLDGNFSPERLDPFGTKDRPMYWNIVGHKPENERENTVGYVWMEVGKLGDDGPEYFTAGAGFKAGAVNKDVKAWYFTTNLRVGEELFLTKDRVPLSERSLQEALGETGNCSDRKTYAREVNANLFKLPETQYAQMIESLIRLRKPKLSEKLKDQGISETLSESLPPLEHARIQELADSFDRLEQHRTETESLKSNLKLVESLESIYRDYAKAIVKQRVQIVLLADQELVKARAEALLAEEEHRKALADQVRLREEMAALDRKEKELDGSIDGLKNSKEFKNANQIKHLREDLRRKTEAVERSQKSVEETAVRVRKNEARVEEAKEDVKAKLQEFDRNAVKARAAAARAGLEEAHAQVEILMEKGTFGSAAGNIEAAIRNRKTAIAEVEKLVQDLARQTGRAADQEKQVALRQSVLEDQRERVEKAREAQDQEAESYEKRITAWLEGENNPLLGLYLGPVLESQDFEKIPGLVSEEAAAQEAHIHKKRVAAETAVSQVQTDVAKLRQEKECVLSEPHRAPVAAAWRTPRTSDASGAPFYMLCEFKDLDKGEEGRIEAALEASGILDAWVTEDGIVLDSSRADVFFRASPVKGSTLAAFLVPVAHNGISEKVAKSVLSTISVVPAGREASDQEVFVSPDGRWKIGPLTGKYVKPAAQYIGENARERNRKAKLKELNGAIETALATLETAKEEVAKLVSEHDSLRSFVGSLPSLDGFRRATIAREQAQAIADDHAALLEQDRKVLEEEKKKAEKLTYERDLAATNRGIAVWVPKLQELRTLTFEYEAEARPALQAASAHAGAQKSLGRCEGDLDEAKKALEIVRKNFEKDEADLVNAQSFLKSLETSLKKTPEEIIRSLEDLEEKSRLVKDEKAAKIQDQVAMAEQAGQAKNRHEDRREELARREGAMTEAGTMLDRLLQSSVFLSAHLECEADVQNLPSAVTRAEKMDADLKRVDSNPKVVESLANRLPKKLEEIILKLPDHMKISQAVEDGIWVYSCYVSGTEHSLSEVIRVFGEELQERLRNMTEEEGKAISKFLSEETMDYLRARLRESSALVKEMNDRLAESPTNTGTILKLRWGIHPEAPTQTRKAVDIFMKDSKLINDFEKELLRDFMKAQLEKVRNTMDDHRSMTERMNDVFDYRKWHQFDLFIREPKEDWKPFTRKEHNAKSGGAKGFLILIPMFAAAMAFYKSAKNAPRIVAMDEAFAGIDQDKRAELMRLAFGFDLDVIMTSYDEWGCYPGVELAIYSLSRTKEMPGVLAERFIWDGNERTQIEE